MARKPRRTPHDDAPKPGLSANHARTISTALSKVEKDILEIERYVRSPPHGRMYELVDDLTDAQKDKLLDKIEQLKECIRDFADALNLTPDKASLSGMIRGKLSIDWANACDIQADKLSSYGPVDPATAPLVTLHAQRLMAILNTVD